MWRDTYCYLPRYLRFTQLNRVNEGHRHFLPYPTYLPTLIKNPFVSMLIPFALCLLGTVQRYEDTKIPKYLPRYECESEARRIGKKKQENAIGTLGSFSRKAET